MEQMPYRPQAIVWQSAPTKSPGGGAGGGGSASASKRIEKGGGQGEGSSSNSDSSTSSKDGDGSMDWSSLLKQMQENQRYLTQTMNEHDVNMANINNTAAQRQTETQVQGNRDVATIQGQWNNQAENTRGQWGNTIAETEGRWNNQAQETKGKWDNTIAATQGDWANRVAGTQGDWANRVAETQGRWSNKNIDTQGKWDSQIEGEKHGYRMTENEQMYGFDLGRMEKQYSVSSRLQGERSEQEKAEEKNRMDQVIRREHDQHGRASTLWANRGRG